MKKILLLTSGGDSSGMNAFLNAFICLAEKENIEVLASYNGYNGIVDDVIEPLTTLDVENIFSIGGSIIGAGRCPAFRKDDVVKACAEKIKQLNVECVVIVGGNGSYKGAKHLSEFGINVLLVPATIDNDIAYTDLSLGFDTAVNNAVDAVIKISQSMKALKRGVIIETMGRDCNDITIYSATATMADMIITKEQNFENILNQVKEVIKCEPNPIIVVKENLIDVEKLAIYLEQETNKEFRSAKLGYIQRGGTPTVYDKILAVQFAVKTMELIMENSFNKAVGYKNNEVISVSMQDAMNITETHNKHLLEVFNKMKKN